MTITTTHKLLTDSWTAEVETLETAVGRFKTDHAPSEVPVGYFSASSSSTVKVPLSKLSAKPFNL